MMSQGHTANATPDNSREYLTLTEIAILPRRHQAGIMGAKGGCGDFAVEVEQVLNSEPKIRFVEKGDREGEDVYLALGQTDAGRYLAILFIYKKTQEALILSARDMAIKERRRYGKK